MSGRGAQGVLAAALLAIGAAAAAAPPFAPLPDALPEASAPWYQRAFDALAADFDRDGDDDLLINWHHHAPLALLENRGGRFVAVPETASGLLENRGIPALFAAAEAQERRIEAYGAAGLYVWHDLNRGQRWRFLWLDPAGGPLRLELETSLRLLEHGGLAGGEVEAPDARRLRVALDGRRRAFDVWALRASSQLKIAAADGAAPALFVGSALTPAAAPLSLWKPDPHGMAWVDIGGSAHPELYLTRGALGGELAPPADPKEDRLYRHRGGGPPAYARAAPGAVPPGYGRGRRVEWVDADGDGRAELALANREGANQLLDFGAQGEALRDRAAELGLTDTGTAQVWGDHDGDGRDDVYFLAGDAIDVAVQRATGFERLDGAALGLTLPPAEPGRGAIDSTALRLADVDADGDLDLWVIGRGQAGRCHVFRREAAGFSDATEALGLAGLSGVRAAVIADFDGDADEDAVSFGARADYWENRGSRFAVTPLAGLPRAAHAAAVLDVDGDGHPDLLAAGRRAGLLRNTATGETLEVTLRGSSGEPIGALVVARYADGRRLARRYGSVDSTAFSQSLRPLRFARPEGNALLEIAVRWPGAAGLERHTPKAGSPALRLSR